MGSPGGRPPTTIPPSAAATPIAWLQFSPAPSLGVRARIVVGRVQLAMPAAALGPAEHASWTISAPRPTLSPSFVDASATSTAISASKWLGDGDLLY